jgi:hypothetical protein
MILYQCPSLLTGSSASKSGDTQLCGCRISEDCDRVNSFRLGSGSEEEFCTSTWFNGVWFGRLIGAELSRTLAAANTAFVAVARALISSVSDCNA